MRGNLEILHWASAAAAHDPVALGAVRDELVEAVPA
jgi:hypothetical protein